MDNENFNVEFGEVVNIGGGTSDFNQLSNRPKYNNATMTGDTNIPKVPTKTSELNNDSDYQTGTEVSSAIDTAVSGLDIPTKTSDLTNDGSDGTSTYVESDDLATVATSGSYNDLSNTPTIPESQVQSDWSQTDNTKVDFIKNKPTIPSAQVNADWNASSGVAEILNKPTIPTVNDATLTITQNGTAKGTFTANDADDTTIEVKDTTYTAGSNVAISDQNVISATDTTYSNFVGTDGTTAGTAGLVPAPATTDAGKFLKADGTWDTAGGGGGPTVVQTAGASTTDVMSQNAVTSMIWSSNRASIEIGEGSTTNNLGSIALGTGSGSTYNARATGTSSIAIGPGNGAAATNPNSIAIGSGAAATGDYAIRIGSPSSTSGDPAQNSGAKGKGSIAIGQLAETSASAQGGVAIGAGASASSVGEFNIGSASTSYGYNSSNYRLLSGLYDPQSAHDAATKGYVDPTTDSSAPTTATVGRLGQIQIDTTNADAYMCVAVDTVTPSYTWKKITA